MTETQPLVVRADPRLAQDGITADVLREQLAHNLRVRDLVSEVNIAVAKLGAIDKPRQSEETMRRLQSLQRLLVTPPIRYSEPALQSHIQYLYGAAMAADQKVGRDAEIRYRELRRQLDEILRELRPLSP